MCSAAKMKIVSSFIIHVVPNLYEIHSIEHKIIYFEECWNQTVSQSIFLHFTEDIKSFRL